MKKSTGLVLVITAVLVLVVAVFAFLNRNYVAAKKEAQESGTFTVSANSEPYTVSLDDIRALSPFDITANYKKSGQAPVDKVYQGVSLKAVIESLGIDPSGFASVAFTAADGYASALTLAEAMDEGNCYIVIGLDNAPLGTKESGGSGPFMMILAHDPFSQRWCKFLLEVEFKS